MLEFTVVTISVFVSTLNEITKTISKGVFHKEINKFIPIFSILYGICLAIIAFYTGLSNFGNNVIEAIFIGLSSGAAAVGYHQVGKQLFKDSVILPTIEDTTEQGQTDDDKEEVVELPDTEVSDVENTDVEDVENTTIEDVENVDVDDTDEYEV